MSSTDGTAHPSVVVASGPEAGQTLVIDAPMVEKSIGSGTNAHLRLSSPGIDAIHAVLTWEDRGVVVTDVGSDAGVYVNGEKVEDDRVVKDGDRLCLGKPGGANSVPMLVQVPAAFNPADSGPPLVLKLEDTPLPTQPEALVLEPVAPAAASAPAKPYAPAIIFNERTPAAPPKKATPHATDGDVSIVSDRVREPLAVPEASPPPPPRKVTGKRPAVAARRGAGGLPLARVAAVAVGAAVLAGGGFFFYARMQRAPPVLVSLVPPKIEPGQTVTVKGSGFDASAGAQEVRFGDAVGTVTNATESDLTVTVPATLAADGPVELQVVVDRGGARSNALFAKIVRYPKVTRVEPDVALPGAEVVVQGQNLQSKILVVKVADVRAEVKDRQPGAVRIVVPEMAYREGRAVPVTVEVGPETTRPFTILLGRLPLVSEVAPSSGPVGQRVTIKGRGFDPTPDGNRVTFAGEPALVLAATDRELQVAVPAPPGGPTAPPGPQKVSVEVKGAASGGEPLFVLARPSAGIYRPQFFAARVPEGPPDRYAFVSTDIGPLLLLTGKADAPSVGERAVRVTTALAAAMEAASTRAVTVEVRDGAAPAVTLAGGAVLVTATPDDTEGYARAWEGGKAAGRTSPRQLANYWAAVLQDYFTLFGQGQRPTRVVEVAAGTRVLMDVYAAAERRGLSGGVPIGAVSMMPAAMSKSIRDMALTVPAAGAPVVAGAAVTGRWEGTLSEASGERPISLDLQMEGARLGGRLMTKTGAIAVQIPLQRVTYDKGLLKFSASLGGANKEFQGRLDGSTLAGDVFKDAAAKQAVGRFSVKYVQ